MDVKPPFNGGRQESAGRFDVPMLSGQTVASLLSIDEAIEAVERSFVLAARGETVMPPKLYLGLPHYDGDFRAMPAYIDGMAGIKWVSVHPGNPGRGLPSVQALIVLNDPATGRTLAIMDGTYITTVRTGAAGAVAVKYLARKDSRVIGIIGAGQQGKTQLIAISRVVPHLEQARVYDVKKSASLDYVREMKEIVKFDIGTAGSIEEAAGADIVVAATPSRMPIIKESYVKPGTHINAIGADAPGKQELESSLVGRSTVIVDDIEQAVHSGEVNVPLSEGAITRGHIAGTLGEVITGTLDGRRSRDEITIFDSTGLAIHDIICARSVYLKTRGLK
jgi:alanine dehydrogenase